MWKRDVEESGNVRLLAVAGLEVGSGDMSHRMQAPLEAGAGKKCSSRASGKEGGPTYILILAQQDSRISGY